MRRRLLPSLSAALPGALPAALPAALATALVAASVTGCSALPGGDEPFEVTVQLTDAAGLFVGNDVGVLGVPVGEVVAVEPSGPFVDVVLRLDGDQPVPADVVAAVVSRSVATDRYVELSPPYDGGPRLEDGDVVPASRTAVPVDFDAVLTTLERLATGVSGSGETRRAVARLLEAGASALDGQGEPLRRAVGGLGDAADVLAAQRGEVVGTVEALDELLGVLARDRATVRTFVSQVADVTDLLADERESFRRALRSLDRAVGALADFAVRNRDDLVRVLDGSSALVDQVLSARTDLEEVLRVFPLVLQNLPRVVDDGALQVRLSPTELAPLGDEVLDACRRLGADVCDAVGVDPLGVLLGGGAR